MSDETNTPNNPETLRSLRIALADLRQAYAHLSDGTVKDQQSLAAGLIAPVIRRLEGLCEAQPADTPAAKAPMATEAGGEAYDVTVVATYRLTVPARSTGAAEREALARIKPGHPRHIEVPGPALDARAHIRGQDRIAADLHERWIDANMPYDTEFLYEDDAVCNAASIRTLARQQGLWPEGEDASDSLFNALLEYCKD